MEQSNIENKPERGERGPISKEFFELQFEFAKALAEANKRAGTDIPLLEMVRRVAPAIQASVFSYDAERREFSSDIKPGVTEANLVEKAYEGYLEHVKKEQAASVEIDPNEPRRQFGALYYVVPENQHADEQMGKENITFHFAHNYDESAKRLLGLDALRASMGEMLQELKQRYPDAKTLSTASWLLDAMPESVAQQLFPQAFLDSLKVKDSKYGWGMGTMIWGQFLDVNGNVKKKLADELLKNVKGMKEEEYLIDLLRPPLYKPKSGIAPIEEFYKMYGI